MILLYEDRGEMQRSMRKASIREVYVREREGRVRVTALIDSRSIALYECASGNSILQDEMASWKDEHFEVIRGEVMLDVPEPGSRTV